MKKFVLVLVSLIVLSVGIKAQKQSFLEWQKTYGSKGSDAVLSTHQTKDGGYISGGYSGQYGTGIAGNHGGSDYWIFKTNNTGALLWRKNYGGSQDDFLDRLIVTSDGGYIATGVTYSKDGDVTGFHGNNTYEGDCWIIKTDSAGKLQWEKTYGGTKYDRGYDIQQTKDGGYIVTGITESKNGDVSANYGYDDGWIFKIDSAGKLIWSKTFGGKGDDELLSLQQTGDQGYIAAGYSYSTDIPGCVNKGKSDSWVISINDTGSIQWQKFYGGKNDDGATSIILTPDKGYIFAGFTESIDAYPDNHGKSDVLAVKINETGNVLWQNVYGGGNYDNAADIISTKNGYALACTTNSETGQIDHNNHGVSDVWVIQLNNAGKIISANTLGGSNYETGHSIAQTSDEGFIIGAQAESIDGNVTTRRGGAEGWIIKLSPYVPGHSIVVTDYDTAATCTVYNYITFRVDDSMPVTLNLYRFGVLYKTRGSVKEYATFNDLKPGQYYATMSEGSKIVRTSKYVNIIPELDTAFATDVTSTKAIIKLNTDNKCATGYSVEIKKINSDTWSTRNGNFFYHPTSVYLNDLTPVTTYLVRVGLTIRENGINATGKRYDSLTFTTLASGDAATAEKLNLLSNNITILPNPASSYFIINYNSATNKKANAVLYDVNGKAVWTSGLVSTDAFISKKVITSQLPNGVYYLKLMDDAGASINTKKIIISR